jgi:CCR4-NOT transcription complex subunit 6
MLANCWAGEISETSKRRKYPHCNPDYLCWSYRLPLIKRDLVSFGADIICLQEVDYGKYREDLEPFMSRQGYSSCIQSCKDEGKQRYAVATFFRSERFEFVTQVSKSRGMTTIVRETGGSRMLGIVNCHLQAYPSSEKVRFTQLRSLTLAFEEFKLTHSFVVGDFNCEEGEMCLTWATMHHTGETNPAQDLTHRSILHSVFLGDTTPSYIGPGPRFAGLRLDHILASQTTRFKAGIHPFGHRAEDITTQGLPNRMCPSDHLPVGGVFTLTRTSKPFFLPEQPSKPTCVALTDDVIDEWTMLVQSAPKKLTKGKPTATELEALKSHAALKKSFLSSLLPEEQKYLKQLAKSIASSVTSSPNTS